MRKYVISSLLLSALFVLASCAGPQPEAKKAKEPEKPPEPVTARRAFHQMYLQARSWATDVEGLRLQSITLDSVPSVDGRYGAWRGTFVSPSRSAAKSFTYSVVQAQGLYKGVFALPEENYSGPSGQTSPFPIQALQVDSDAALKTAMARGADYAKKNPGKPITFLLENNKRFPNTTWRVIWGESAATSNFSIFVDASTGDYKETMR